MTHHSSLEQAAALFLARSQQPDWSDADQRELDLWLEQSMAHMAAFWRLQDGGVRVDRHLTAALARHEPDGGFPDELRRRFQIAITRPVTTLLRPTLLMAGFMAMSIAGYLAFTAPEARPEYTRHMTKFGQIGKLALADGSQVELNTDSDVRIANARTERMLWLDRGEAYFEVAKDEGRPFVVHAGSRRVTVLGTKFAVRREGNDITVSVLEGRVRVTTGTKPDGGSAMLTAGEIAATNGQSMLVTAGRLAQIRKSLSWRFSMLAFDNISLREAAAQFNRYNIRQLVIEGSEAQNLRISGSFRMGNVEGFASLLEHAYGLDVRRSENNIEINSP
ncbi:FecR family protein [Sphingobium tyrosinilyticum]|uniref:FecR family protein n=1 Tax=Sphingobium tyrosinilyticum TaxID=2715436 RepID=A0ABV9EYC6_9SPHN